MSHICTIPKNRTEEIRVSLDDFKGNQLVNLRVWFQNSDGEMRPGKQGIAFKLALLPEVLAALHRAEGGAV